MLARSALLACRGAARGVAARRAVATQSKAEVLTSLRDTVEPFVVDFSDTRTAFRPRSSVELAASLTMLRLCQFDTVVKVGSALLTTRALESLVYWVIRHTFFRHFCAGETLESTKHVVQRLRASGVGSILDYAAEASDTGTAGFEQNAEFILDTIRLAREAPGVQFSCLKTSALTSTEFLRAHSALLAGDTTVDAAWVEQEHQAVMGRLHRICDAARDQQLPLLIDAEQSYYQGSIDHITLELCKEYNKAEPVVYNTYQMYRRDAFDRLVEHHALCRDNGVALGVKLVRGAYKDHENELAEEEGRISPVFGTIDETHASYNRGVEYLIEHSDSTGVVFATHNQASIELALAEMNKRKIDPREARVVFGQLYGMADHLSLTLGQHTIKVCKYIPFGPLREVIPYLMRRLEENGDVLGGTRKETHLLWVELLRRARSGGAAGVKGVA